MATYISLVNFTDQGLRNVKQTIERSEIFKAQAADLGVKVKDMYWTLGHHDIVTILEGQDEAVVSAVLNSWAYGNVRGQTMRAFNATEMAEILADSA